MNIKKELRDIFVENPWWDKTIEEINTEHRQIKWIFRGLVAFGILIVIYMLVNGLFLHN